MEGFDQLNKAFDSRVRMGIMSILIVNSWVSYKNLKSLLETGRQVELKKLILALKKCLLKKTYQLEKDHLWQDLDQYFLR